jgi:hypothetical protein
MRINSLKFFSATLLNFSKLNLSAINRKSGMIPKVSRCTMGMLTIFACNKIQYIYIKFVLFRADIKTYPRSLRSLKKIPGTPYFCKCKMENDFQLKMKS